MSLQISGDAKRQRQVKEIEEMKMLKRDQVHDGTLEDILCGNALFIHDLSSTTDTATTSATTTTTIRN